MRKKIAKIRSEPLLLLAIPISLISLLMIFILRPLIKVRVGFLHCDRLGHFAPDIELYLCEREIKKFKHKTLDLFYFPREPCNHQLALMCRRKLNILSWFILRPLDLIIRSFSFLSDYRAITGRGAERDIDNLLDQLPIHLDFTTEEEDCGRAALSKMGIKENQPFVCLNVRDSAYLKHLYKGSDTSYHNYRNSDINNYILATKALVDRGYFVIRMGSLVNDALNFNHPNFIDYAANGLRSEFMDIYLGSKCDFCITTGTGWDSIPEMFRRPMVYINMLPIVHIHTFRTNMISITKKHVLRATQETLTLSEIFARSVGFCVHTSDYEIKGVDLIENTPEEICDVVIEMAERLEGNWQAYPDDEALQQLFWEIFPTDAVNTNGVPLHGEIRSRFGADFLRNNKVWLS